MHRRQFLSLCAALSTHAQPPPKRRRGWPLAAGGFANLEGMTLAPWMWVAVIASAMLMGTVAAIIPALGASRTSIIDAMRYSG